MALPIFSSVCLADSWDTAGSMTTARGRGHTATLLANGKVLVTGGFGAYGNDVHFSSAELYDPATNTWSPAGSMTTARVEHTATLLPDGRVLVAGGDSYDGFNGSLLNSAEVYDPASNTWSSAGSMAFGHANHTATLLANGKVLIAGGFNYTNSPTASAELYDPATNNWSSAGYLKSGRGRHTATLLLDGRVLIAGGGTYAELFDSVNNSWNYAGSSFMTTSRYGHTATLLPGGKVLVAGGNQYSGGNGAFLATAEIYDPATNSGSAASSMATARMGQTATLLSNGKVFVAGGFNYNNQTGGYNTFSSAELYDPATDRWDTAGTMASTRFNHNAMLLPNAKVLVAGGSADLSLSTAELYGPATDTNPPATFVLPPGGIYPSPQIVSLIANEPSTIYFTLDGSTPSTYSTIYSTPLSISTNTVVTFFAKDTAGNSETVKTAVFTIDTTPPVTTATPPGGTYSTPQIIVLSANEPAIIYFTLDGSTPTTGSSVYQVPISIATNTTLRFFARDMAGNIEAVKTETFVSLSYPLTAAVIGCGTLNYSTGGECTDNCTQSFDTGTTVNLTPATCTGSSFVGWTGCDQISGNQCTVSMNAIKNVFATFTGDGVWSVAGALANGRQFHTATLLANGNVLVTGGLDDLSELFSSTELYNPGANSWTSAGSMSTARVNHSATLLLNGKVLVAGGNVYNGIYFASSELYDLHTNKWSPASSMSFSRTSHTATLLPDGRILVTGGYSGALLSSAELYDPVVDSWSPAGSMTTARSGHTATLLPSGKVLVTGGYGNALLSEELYDPVSNSWSQAGSMTMPRSGHTATLLDNGKVLIAGGYKNGSNPSNSELYDPDSNTWSAVRPTSTVRSTHTATLLPNGKVLVTGGSGLASSELYDPLTDRWTSAGSMASAREGHAATLLLYGKVLVTGGGDYGQQNYGNNPRFTEVYSSPNDSIPPITAITPAGGDYTNAQTITLASDRPATIYYMATGATGWTPYTGPFTISTTTNLQYFAIGTGGQESPQSATFRITPVGGGSLGFAPPIQMTFPSQTWGVAAADFNQDGKADLAVVSYDLSTVTAYKGNGDGTFTSVQEFGVGAQPTSVCFGTLNGYDNFLDIGTASSGSGSVSFQLGNGANAFSYASAYSSGAGTTSMVIGHFSSSGPDLAVINNSTGYLNIYSALTPGVFTPGQSYYVGLGAISVAKGEFNGDFYEDLAVVNHDSGQLIVLFGDGTGHFYTNTGSYYSTPQFARSVAAGDINGDGKTDLVVVSDGGDTPGGMAIVTVLLGGAYGSFQQYAQFKEPQFTSGVAIADFNSDGKADLVFANRSTGVVSVLLQGFQLGSTVRINGANPVYYATVQAALSDAGDGTVVEMIAGDTYGDLTLDRDIHVTLRGGISGSGATGYTILHGTLTITTGSVVAEYLTII